MNLPSFRTMHRSPKDKFFVKNEASADSVWWTSEDYKNDNKPCTEEAWADLKAKAVKQLSGITLITVTEQPQ